MFDQFNASLKNKNRSYWPQTFELPYHNYEMTVSSAKK